MKPRHTPSIRERLVEHLTGDGTPNDLDTDALYREAHSLDEDAETDLETVEQWAVSLARGES